VCEFEQVKRIIEAEQGKPLEPSGEIIVKGLYYFGQGIKLKNQLKSESKHVGTIAHCVFEDIEAHMERRRNRQQQAQIIQAIKGFMNSSRTKNRSKQR
jgi:hypothetical protein